MTTLDEIAALLARDGVVVRRDHPELVDALDWRVRRGELVAVLPGVYTVPERSRDPLTIMVALSRSRPDTVLTGASAARLSYWPEVRVGAITATTVHRRMPRPGIEWQRRRIPPQLVTARHGVRVTAPSLTALDMSDLDHTEPLDVALRKRVVTIASLRAALEATRYRSGNAARWAVLLDSRDKPWSYPERLGHRLLRHEGITGWRANCPFSVSGGETYFIDIAFEWIRLAVEIDGRIHATDREVFESDRRRQNDLVLAGWRVLRFTYRMMEDRPDVFIRTLRAAM